jgi:hypothetical protein
MVYAHLDYVGMNASPIVSNEGFSPCKAEPDIWMRLNGNLYEYVAMYVDDLCLGMLDPKSFTDTLQKK